MIERNRLLVMADRLRRLYWRLWGPRTVGIRTVVRDGDRVLLIRHTYGSAQWQLPGGGVHRRETVEEAARRETKEETGIVVAETPGALRLFGVFSNLRDGKSDHVVVFEVVEWSKGESDSDSEIADVDWFPLDDLPASTSPGTRRRLAEIASGTTPGFRW